MAFRFRRGPFLSFTLSVACGVAVACGGSDGSVLFDPSANDAGGDGGGAADSGGTDTNNSTTDTGGPDTSISCTAPMANCSGNPSDGCNVNLQTSNQHCGGCGVVCNTTCAAGICPLIQVPDGGVVPPVGDFACIAIDGANVYVANGRGNPNGVVYKVPVNGGVPTPLGTGLASPHGITSDGTNVYFTTTTATGSIWRVPVTALTAPVAIVDGNTTPQNQPIDIVATNTALFWLNRGDGTVWSSTKTGTSAAPVIAATGANRTGQLRVDATSIFWTDGTFGIKSAKIGSGPTGAVSNVVAGNNARFMDISTTTVFFSAGVTGAGATTANITSGPLTGTGQAGTQIAMNLANSKGVATDGVKVYWSLGGTGPSTGSLWRANLDGSNPVALATAQNNPGCIAVDKTSLYWINENGGTISKTAK